MLQKIMEHADLGKPFYAGILREEDQFLVFERGRMGRQIGMGITHINWKFC